MTNGPGRDRIAELSRGGTLGAGSQKKLEKSFEKGLTKAPDCDRINKLSPSGGPVGGSGQLIEN